MTTDSPNAIRRRPLLLALVATLLVAAGRVRRAASRSRFAQRTMPGDRYRSFMLGNRQLYLRDDLMRSGWLRDFHFHRGTGR
jgi:hypothetical protein